MKGEKIEVVHYSEASWAPKTGTGESFDWAIRVTSSTGNQITGVHNGKKQDAMKKAHGYLDRLRNQFGWKVTHMTRTIKEFDKARDAYNARRLAML